MRRPALLLPLVLLLAAGAPARLSPGNPSGEGLVRKMHDRYARSWYRTLTFSQTTSFPGKPAETWYEAGAIPGRLRIDVAPLDRRNAFMYVGDSAYSFRGGKRVAARKDRNLLMTLGFDVYGQDPAITLAQIRESGVDLTRGHEREWQGRPVHVVGAVQGDTTSTQFWVDKERLVFVRLIEQRKNPAKPDAPAALLDVEFNRYQKLGGGWIAPEVVIRVNGKEVQREEYSDMKANVTLPPTLYDTEQYHPPEWIH